MLERDLITYILDVYSIEDILYILGKDKEWLIEQIKDDILEHKEDFLSGDEYYTGVLS